MLYSAEDNGYIADSPALRHCSAFGDTPEEALREVLLANKLWLQTARKHRKPIPKPIYRPAIYQMAR